MIYVCIYSEYYGSEELILYYCAYKYNTTGCRMGLYSDYDVLSITFFTQSSTPVVRKQSCGT
jgi:hypothetical protein